MLVHARCAVRPLLSLWGVMEREPWVGPRVAPIHIGVCFVMGALSEPLRRAVDRSPFSTTSNLVW